MSNFYGDDFRWWVGVVKYVIDETFVQVRIFGIHPLDESELDSSDLPYALVGYPTTGGQTGGGTSGHNLEVDSWVYGFSPDDTFMQPIVLGVIQGSAYSTSTYSGYGGDFVGQSTGGGTSSDGTQQNPNVDTSAKTNIPGGSNAAKAYNYVYSKLQATGMSTNPHMHTAALMGCLEVESPGIRPEVTGGYKGRAWGICQWLNPRRKQLFQKYGRTKRLDQQLDFMWWEITNTEYRAANRWLSSTNLPDATAGFSSFERNDCWKNGKIQRSHPIFKKTLREAYKAYNSHSYGGAPVGGTRTFNTTGGILL